MFVENGIETMFNLVVNMNNQRASLAQCVHCHVSEERPVSSAITWRCCDTCTEY